MNKKIITITLNPSLDATIVTEHLNIGYYNHVAETKHLDASGRGVNISRALGRLETATHAIVTLGDDAISYAYRGLITKESFPASLIQHAGHTRSDTIIVDNYRSNKTETHIIDENSVCTEDDVRSASETLREIIRADDIVVYAGKLPPQTPPDVYVNLIKVAQKAKAKAVVVTNGEVLQHSLLTEPEIVVLRQKELESLFNYPIRTLPDMISAARKLQDQGCQEILMVMNDYETVILVEKNHVFVAEISDINLRGTESGVIDALIASYLSALVNQKTPEKALAFGAAAMAHAIEKIGNEFASIEQVREQMKRVQVRAASTATDGG